ncbi:MAG: MazG nucleotide pyrophosphohydrolase domain-containing protein [Patescibacteria group bacterium]|nr:MazG nucleotide pyrophosphohydrolase domain-containing protein [Patescibacteria group bacterium]
MVLLEVYKWTGQFTPQYWSPYEILARLTEETGELAREVNHLYGTKKKKSNEEEKNLGQELTDVIFTVVCMANSQGIDLNEEWERMMNEKCYGRDNNRYKKK